MMHSLSRQLADTAKFTAVHAGLVIEDEASLTWLLTGSVLMVQQACILALSQADAEIPAMPGPGELAARVADPQVLAQPYTAPLGATDFSALNGLVAARNRVMHPLPAGLDIDTGALPGGLMVAVRLVRHLVLTQPVRPGAIMTGEAMAIGDALTLIDTAADFWETVLAEA